MKWNARAGHGRGKTRKCNARAGKGQARARNDKEYMTTHQQYRTMAGKARTIPDRKCKVEKEWAGMAAGEDMADREQARQGTAWKGA